MSIPISMIGKSSLLLRGDLLGLGLDERHRPGALAFDELRAGLADEVERLPDIVR